MSEEFNNICNLCKHPFKFDLTHGLLNYYSSDILNLLLLYNCTKCPIRYKCNLDPYELCAFYNGVKYSMDEIERIIKLKAFL